MGMYKELYSDELYRRHLERQELEEELEAEFSDRFPPMTDADVEALAAANGQNQ